MPPPIEDEEETQQHPRHITTSAEDALDVESSVGTGHVTEAKPSHHHREQPHHREDSPVLVVSDIMMADSVAPAPAPAPAPPRKALPSLKPTTTTTTTHPVERGGGKGKKRSIVDDRSNHGPLAKRRKGQRREIPCNYCVRRLANDPRWVCHEAVVGPNGQGYTGARCSECVGAHVSCVLIPDKASAPVQALVKAAADVVAGDGINTIAIHAAYEAAIGPALRAIAVKNPAPQTTERKKHHQQKPPNKKPLPTGRPPAHRSPRLTPTNQQQSSSAESRASFQPDPNPNLFAAHPQQHHDPAALERLEHQALRRRKVEALESLAHTSALLLAEFMSFNQRHAAAIAAATNTPPLAGPATDRRSQQQQQQQDNGAEYAAAAAASIVAYNIIQPQPQQQQQQPYTWAERNGNSASGGGRAQTDRADESSDGGSTISNGDRTRKAASASASAVVGGGGGGDSGEDEAKVEVNGDEESEGFESEEEEDNRGSEPIVVEKQEEDVDDNEQQAEVKVEDD